MDNRERTRVILLEEQKNNTDFGAVNGYVARSRSGRTCSTCKQLPFCSCADNDTRDHFCYEEKSIDNADYQAKGVY